MAEARREHPSAALAETPREGVPERRTTSAGRRQVELTLTNAQQNLRVRSQVAELVHLVVPPPVGTQMRARGVRGIEHVRDERLGPWVAVETRADDLSVLRPRIAGVGCGVDRADREATGAHTLHDRLLLLRAPRRLTDREERECTSLANRVDRELPYVFDPPGAQPVHLRDLTDSYRSLVEHAVHTRRPVAIRRDLGHEQQRTGHDAAR